MKKAVLFFTLMLLVALVSGCTSSVTSGVVKQESSVGQETGVQAQAGDTVVNLVDMRFVPEVVQAKASGRVLFINNDTTEHDVVIVTQSGEEVNSPVLKPGGNWSYVPSGAGTYTLKCMVAGHYALGMTGSLLVK